MTRTTNYYGQKIGAVVIEKRKGSVSQVSVGTIYRYTASEQGMGAPALKFTPRTILCDKEAKEIARALKVLRVAQWQQNVPSWDACGDFDSALHRYWVSWQF
jgi:hypothetical protein